MGKKIFFVDDERVIRKTISTVLKRHRTDDEIHVFADPQHLLTAVIEGMYPDMVITDRSMFKDVDSPMYGEELAARLREHGFKGPILLLTGESEITSMPNCDAVAHKPISPSDLVALVARFLDA